jgi:DNA-binding IclR family transcriptional regulator
MGGEQGRRLVGADRVLAVLVELAQHPDGANLEQIAVAIDSPKSTAHRALATLKRHRLATQTGRGTYVLGDEFVRLALRHHDSRPEAVQVMPLLRQLVARYDETAHFAVIEGNEVVYRAKVDPPAGAVRLTSVIGGRNPAYRTAVGKMLLALEVGSRNELSQRISAAELVAKTPKTITDLDELWRELAMNRERGFAIDDQENEVGVNCIALPVLTAQNGTPLGAVSISALAFRMPLPRLLDELEQIRALVSRV